MNSPSLRVSEEKENQLSTKSKEIERNANACKPRRSLETKHRADKKTLDHGKAFNNYQAVRMHLHIFLKYVGRKYTSSLQPTQRHTFPRLFTSEPNFTHRTDCDGPACIQGGAEIHARRCWHLATRHYFFPWMILQLIIPIKTACLGPLIRGGEEPSLTVVGGKSNLLSVCEWWDGGMVEMEWRDGGWSWVGSWGEVGWRDGRMK